MAGSADLLFGPYGSGPGRAVAAAMAGRPEPVWNHGAAAVEPRGRARLVDVLGPARAYWRGLPDVLAGRGAGRARARPRRLRRRGRGRRGRRPGGRRDAARARSSTSTRRGRGTRSSGAVAAGARWVAGGGRMEDDLALAEAAVAAGLRCALVVMGVAAAGRGARGRRRRVRRAGRSGTATAPAGRSRCRRAPTTPPPRPRPPGILAERALELAGGGGADALWDAARGMRAATPLGPFAVDADGRQTAHAPAIVRWEPAAGRPRPARGVAPAPSRRRDRLPP